MGQGVVVTSWKCGRFEEETLESGHDGYNGQKQGQAEENCAIGRAKRGWERTDFKQS